MGENGQYENSVMATYNLMEQSENSKARRSLWSSDGVIQEVAESRCGGADKLRAAVSRGAVRVFMEAGIEMFSLPSIGTQVTDQVKKCVTSKADTALTEEQYTELRDLC